jgi:hypothetical protein
MNYTHLNKVYDYWSKDILPHLSHIFTIGGFDDYLKRFSYLPSGKWIKDLEKIKLTRLGFAIDPKQFVTKYKNVCVAYNSPIKPEDGIQRVIYQISSTLHVEIGIWIWVEHETLQSYASVFSCYHDDIEYQKFVDELLKMKREGNTEEKTMKGFASLMRPGDIL